MRGPLTIHPTVEAHEYDAEFTVVLGDWYHDEHSVLLDQFINIANPGGAEPVPGEKISRPADFLFDPSSSLDSALIYFAQNGTYLAPLSGTASGAVGFNNNASLPFEAGKTYRLRVVNTSAFAMFFFWIDGHDMRIVSTYCYSYYTIVV